MALEGSLKDFGLADIFQLIYHQKKTGTLTMKNASMEAKVLFENGCVVKAESSNLEGPNKIGQILARSNKITEDQLKQALSNQQNSKDKIGEILIGMGAIQKEDLVKALGIHVREAVLSLFKWKEGRYSFEPSEMISIERDYWLPVNTEFLIMEGVRRIDEWPFIEKKIPNLEIVFEKSGEITDTLRVANSEEDPTADIFAEKKTDKEIQITQEEMNIYNLIDGQQNVRGLIDITNMGEFETCKALSNLLTAGLIVQKYKTDAPKKEIGTTTPSKVRISWLSSRQLLSGLIIFICILIMVAGGWQIMQRAKETEDFVGLYRNMGLENRMQGIANTILVYHYRNAQLPKSLDVLSHEGYISEKSPLRGVTTEIGYEMQSDASSFTLKTDGNP